MHNFTFKVIPAPRGLPNNKPLNKSQANASPEGPAASKPEDSCPPQAPQTPQAPQAPQVPQPPCTPIAPAPPPQPMIPYEPMTPFEPMNPFEPMKPQFPCPPYQGQFPYPSPEPLVPILPGYTITPWIAHANVPWQFYAVVYNASEALFNGTLFPELNQPQGEYGPCEGPHPCKMVYPQGGAPDA